MIRYAYRVHYAAFGLLLLAAVIECLLECGPAWSTWVTDSFFAFVLLALGIQARKEGIYISHISYTVLGTMLLFYLYRSYVWTEHAFSFFEDRNDFPVNTFRALFYYKTVVIMIALAGNFIFMTEDD